MKGQLEGPQTSLIKFAFMIIFSPFHLLFFPPPFLSPQMDELICTYGLQLWPPTFRTNVHPLFSKTRVDAIGRRMSRTASTESGLLFEQRSFLRENCCNFGDHGTCAQEAEARVTVTMAITAAQTFGSFPGIPVLGKVIYTRKE